MLILLYSEDLLTVLFISYYKPFREIPDPPSMLLPEKTLDYEPETDCSTSLFRYTANNVSERRYLSLFNWQRISRMDSHF